MKEYDLNRLIENTKFLNSLINDFSEKKIIQKQKRGCQLFKQKGL